MKECGRPRARAAVGIALGLLAGLVLGGTPCRAQSAQANPPRFSPAASDPGSRDFFWSHRSRITFGFQVAYGLQDAIPRDISHINMVYAQPQLGWIAWDSPHSRLPLKRFEILSEGILGNAIHPGGHLYGQTLLLRFDFTPLRHVVPFFDAGSGVVNTTVESRVPEVTGRTQFLSQGGMGIQYFYRPQRAWVIEYRYFHMSNAGLQIPNPGFNGNMLSIGYRWLLGPRQPGWQSRNSRHWFDRILGK
jgi:Lipid A 3-O-deacylase (PagL)